MATADLSLIQQSHETMAKLIGFFKEYEHLKLLKVRDFTLQLFPGSADDITDLEDYLLLHVVIENDTVVVYVTVYSEPDDNDFKFESGTATIDWFTGKNICFADCEDGYNALYVVTDYDKMCPHCGKQI